MAAGRRRGDWVAGQHPGKGGHPAGACEHRDGLREEGVPASKDVRIRLGGRACRWLPTSQLSQAGGGYRGWRVNHCSSWEAPLNLGTLWLATVIVALFSPANTSARSASSVADRKPVYEEGKLVNAGDQKGKKKCFWLKTGSYNSTNFLNILSVWRKLLFRTHDVQWNKWQMIYWSPKKADM